MTEPAGRLAAIRFDHGDAIDDLLEVAARSLQARGAKVCGCLQRETEDPGSCCNITYLEDVSGGARRRISQPLGAGSRGCRLDPRALAVISGLLLTELDSDLDFLVLNRFGKGESEGQGFRAVIEKAFDKGIPVLTAVREAYGDAWMRFTDGVAQLLPPEERAVLDWAAAAVDQTEPNRVPA